MNKKERSIIDGLVNRIKWVVSDPLSYVEYNSKQQLINLGREAEKMLAPEAAKKKKK